MTWGAISAVSDLVASIAIIISLVYLAKQIKHANLLSQGQTRRDMLEIGQNELYKVFDNPQIWELINKESLTSEERVKLHTWLLASMRLREFEWSQHQFGIVDEDTYNAHSEVIPIVLGTRRSRDWWAVRGTTAFNPKFVEFVNKKIEQSPLTKYWEIGDNW